MGILYDAMTPAPWCPQCACWHHVSAPHITPGPITQARTATPHTDDAAKAQAARRRADDDALISRVLTLQLAAVIQQYGAPALMDAAADALIEHGIMLSSAHHYRPATECSISAGRLRYAAQQIRAYRDPAPTTDR